METGWFQQHLGVAPAEKRAIARYVLGNILRPCESIYMDAGTTVAAIMKELVSWSERKLFELKILTNNMAVFRMYQEHSAQLGRLGIRLELSGGEYNYSHDALYGHQAETSLAAFFPNVLIMSASGFRLWPYYEDQEKTASNGLYYHGGIDEGVITETLLSHPTDHRLIVFEGGKLGWHDAHKAGQLSRLWENTRHVTVLTTMPTESQQGDGKDHILKQPISDFKRFSEELDYLDCVVSAVPDAVRFDFIVLEAKDPERPEIHRAWTTSIPMNVLLDVDRARSSEDHWDEAMNRRFHQDCELIAHSHKGSLKSSTGDGQIYALGSVAEALEVAKQLHSEAKKRNTRLRIGVHVGPTDFRRKPQIDGSDQLGEIDRVAHLQKQCQPGRTLLSAEAKQTCFQEVQFENGPEVDGQPTFCHKYA